MATFFKSYVDALRRVYTRLFAGSTDTEHEQALIRLTIAVIAWFYVTFAYEFPTPAFAHSPLWWIVTLFVGAALSLVVAIVYSPGRYDGRRIVGNGLDVGILSYAVYAVEAHMIGVLAVYLWVILGNGFRYGIGYLWWTTALSVGGFSVATAYSNVWHIPSVLWVNALIVLIALPLYCHKFISRLRHFIAQAHHTHQAQRLVMASISHDMRTPLANLSGLTELLHCTPMTAEQEDYLKRLAVATSTLQLLINQVLDTATIEDGRIVLKKKEFNPNTTLEKITAIIAPQAREKNLHFHMEQTPLPVAVIGDECRLMQVLMNMLSNALRYTPEGEITLKVQATPDHPSGEVLVFTIVDTGIGMSEPFLQTFPRVFKREQRCQHTTGYGLGASVTLQLIKLMGGQMHVRSQIDQGTTIVIQLPFDRPQAHAPHTADLGLQDMRALLIGPQGQRLCLHLQQWGVNIDLCHSDQDYYSRLTTEPHRRSAEVVIAERSALTQGVSAFVTRLHHHMPAVPVILIEPPDTVTTVKSPSVTAQVARHDLPALCHALLDVRGQHRSAPSLPHQVFVAEDNETFRLYLKTLLEKMGYIVTVAENGSRAIELLSQRIEYDAYFLDICMPGQNGVEVFQFLRHHHSGHPKVIALTAAANDDMRQRCKALGFAHFLSKPVTMDQLLMALTTPVFHDTTNAHPPAGALPTEGLDRSCLAQCHMLGENFLHGLIATFQTESEQLLAHIENTDCLNTFYRHVHSLKNCAASVGAQHLIQVATEAMHATNADMAQYRLALRDATQATYIALHHYLTDTTTRPTYTTYSGQPHRSHMESQH